MKLVGVCLATLFSFFSASSQQFPLFDSLKNDLARAKTNEEKFNSLEQLGYWYEYLDKKQAADYYQQATKVAELSGEFKLRCRALFDQSFRHSGWGQAATDSAFYYAGKAIELARIENNPEFIAWGNLVMSVISGSVGDNQKAMDHVNQAASIAAGIQNDSLKFNCYLQYSQVFLAKNEKLPAFRHLINAWNLAEQKKNRRMLPEIYGALAFFYSDLGNREKARDYTFLQMNLTWNKPYGRIRLYDHIAAGYTDDQQYEIAMHYFQQGLRLADSLKAPSFLKVDIYNHIMRQYFLMNDYDKCLEYYMQNKELQDIYSKAGYNYFKDMLYGRILAYNGKLDSAAYYFNKSEDLIEEEADIINKIRFYDWYADYYNKAGNLPRAIEYYTKEKNMAERSDNFDALKIALANLDTIYRKKGDFKTALLYSNLYYQYADTLRVLANEKELLSTEINNETQRRERELQLQQEEKQRRYNIQYIGITIAIAIFFIVLVMMGLFRVSPATIRAIGFFAFLLFFEFIFLVFKKKIFTITHGEPWKDFVFMILLAAILVPLHHRVEHRVFAYLTSRKMFKVKGAAWWRLLKRKKTLKETEKTESDA